MRKMNFNIPSSKEEQRKAFIGLVVIVAFAALVSYFVFSGPEKVGGIEKGGKYEELAKDHPQGERFLRFIENGFAKFTNDDPDDDISGYIDIGFYKNELGDIDGAIEAYKEGLKINENVTLILSNLAHIYENKKDYRNAEKYYTRLVEADPTNVRGITDFAGMYRYYFDGKKHAEIIDLVEVKGLTVNPNDLNLLIFLANYYRSDLEDLDRAEIYYRQILELDPKNQAVRVELLNLLRSQGRESEL